ncbi:MAG: hypothetical protein DRJ10_01380, partial [Bacteroidetes bacterium]
MKKLIFIIAILLFCISTNSQERRLALIIGNGHYPVRNLANPENDVKSMEKALKDIGFEVKKYENLKQKEMAQAIDDFGNSLKNYDIGLFFYAGHGIQTKGFNYLIPVDAVLKTESDVEFNCVRVDRVIGKMENAKNNVNFLILDACRDNPYERSWTRSARGRGLATVTSPVGSVIAFATSPGKTALDGSGKNGLFTSGLLKYIDEPDITAIQMFQKVTAYVQKESNGNQLPWISTSLIGDFYLVQGTGKTDNTVVINKKHINAVDIDNPEVSIAVLPFKNYTGKSDQNWLVEGQHEILINELSKISQVKPLRVISRSTVNSFKNYDKSIPDLAREINVEFLVEASVFSFGDSITLQLRLIQVYPKENVVLAQSYSSDFSNILKLHSNIAGQIAKKMNINLSSKDIAKLPQAPTVNPESYKAYLRGMYHIHQL